MKNHLPVIIVIFILGLIIVGTTIYYFTKLTENTIQNNANNNEEESDLNLPSTGNDRIINTNTNTTIRVINDFDKTFFTHNKNLLIMFASWCPNCQKEISEIEKILEHYKNDKNVNIILIAHEYQDTVTDLIDLVENDVDFGKTEIKLDLGRIIRKEIDPEASTIPISYVVDKDGKILEKFNDSLTLEKAIDMIGK